MVSTVYNNKQLLDEVFVISRIIEVEVGVISLSLRLRLITLTETLINNGMVIGLSGAQFGLQSYE